MQPTKTDRAILMMLHNILEKLDPDEAEYHKKAATLLERGYCAGWEDEYLGHLLEPMPAEQMEYVHSILKMYRYLQDSYGQLTPTDQALVTGGNPVFKGFDGNNESELMYYAKFLMTNNHWEEVGDIDNLNTHMPTERRYHAMLAAVPSRESGAYLSAEQINAIVDAR